MAKGTLSVCGRLGSRPRSGGEEEWGPCGRLRWFAWASEDVLLSAGG